MSLDSKQMNELHWLMEMLHNIDVGLVVLNRDYQIQIWNGFMENHSGLLPGEVKDKLLFDLFDEIPQAWFKNKAESVFLLKNKAFTIWEQRPYLFKFQNYRPITGSADYMYQNTTFIPLLSASGEVTHLCLLVYDVTDSAINKSNLEQVNRELATLSQTDGLTKLFNRTYWQHCLLAEYKRWTRSQQHSSLVMIDIDYFKKVNDEYGHMMGDEVIKHLANTIKDCIRETDIAGRYGGEEFAVMLPDTDSEGARVIVERLRAKIARSIIQYNDIELKYTVSMGIAQIDKSMTSHEAWIMSADKALYQSKDNGRNQVTVI